MLLELCGGETKRVQNRKENWFLVCDLVVVVFFFPEECSECDKGVYIGNRVYEEVEKLRMYVSKVQISSRHCKCAHLLGPVVGQYVIYSPAIRGGGSDTQKIKSIIHETHASQHIVSDIYLLSSLTDTTSPPSSEEKNEMEKLCNS